MTAKYRKNFSIFILRLAILVAFAGLYASCGYQEKELILLHTNDSHGSIRAVDSLGGMAERATYIRSVRARYPRVLLVDAGDINTGQVVSNMFDARPDIEAYNEMGYDAVALGNHEFDKPLEVLFRQMQWADFPFLTSNVRWQGKTLGKEYLIKEIDGIKVGIFGLTTRETCEVSVYAGQVRNLTIGGRPIVDTMTYRMATCDFVASGKDGYKAAWPERFRRENTSCLLSEVLIGYIRWKKSVEPLLDGRIRVVDEEEVGKCSKLRPAKR